MWAKEGGSAIFGSAETAKIAPSPIWTRIDSHGCVNQFTAWGPS